MKAQTSSKFLIVPDHQGRTIEIFLNRPKKVFISISLAVIFLLSFFAWQRYVFYRDQVFALINDHSVNSSSINQISHDGVQTKLDLMRLKAEIDLFDQFIASCAEMDNELRNNLKIPHSSVTFADIFQQSTKNRPASFPASSATEINEEMQRNIMESQERQRSYQELMDRTPSGYPVKGLLVNHKNIFQGLGVALKIPVGTLIHATATGRVASIKAMDQADFYVIEIEHPSDVNRQVLTRYLYCTGVLVYEGQELSKGQVIAYTGLIPHLQEPVVGYQLLINKMLIQP